MSPLSRSKVLPFSDFETLCEKGEIYSGLVEGLGKVSWKLDLIHFVWVPAENIGQSPYYRQVSIMEAFYCRNSGFKVVTKKKYTMEVIPPESLEYVDPMAYQAYYPVPPMKQDATRYDLPERHFPGTTGESKSDIKRGLEAGAAIDDALGLPLGVASEFSSGKLLGRIGIGLTAVTVVNDITDGNYVSAVGNTIKAFSGWYGVAWDVGVIIYESERFILHDYWATRNEYIQRERRYQRTRSNWDHRLMEDALRNHSRAEKRYRELMQKKYGPNWYRRRF